MPRQCHLMEIAGAGGGLGFVFGFGQSGQEHTRQNSDNGEHDQEFDKRERPAARPACSAFRFHISLHPQSWPSLVQRGFRGEKVPEKCGGALNGGMLSGLQPGTKGTPG